MSVAKVFWSSWAQGAPYLGAGVETGPGTGEGGTAGTGGSRLGGLVCDDATNRAFSPLEIFPDDLGVGTQLYVPSGNRAEYL